MIGFLCVLCVSVVVVSRVPNNHRDAEDAEIAQRGIKKFTSQNYYDRSFRGMDLDLRFQTASDKIKEATSVGQIFGTIAQVLIELDDSHTYFMPPSRSYDNEYGWTMQIIGDRSMYQQWIREAMPRLKE